MDCEYFERPVRIEQGGLQEKLHCIVAKLDRDRLEEEGIDISVALANAGVSVVGLPGSVATPYSPGVNLTARAAPAPWPRHRPPITDRCLPKKCVPAR